MDNSGIIEKASHYAEAITSLTPSVSSKLDEFFEEIKKWFDELPSEWVTESVLIRKYACYSHFYRWTEQYVEVFRCVAAISDYTPKLADTMYCSWIYRNASRVANFLGLVNESIDYGYKSIDMVEKSQNKPEICKCYNQIGGCFNPLGLYDISFDFYRKAYRIAVEINDYRSKLISLNNMGYNRILVKDYVQAEKILTKGIQMLMAEQSRPDLHIQFNNNLAMVALHHHCFEQAHDYIKAAKQYNAINKITSDAISILQVESDLYLQENKPQKAIDALTDAIGLATEKKLERYALKIEKNLADVLVNENRYEEAIGHLLNGLALQEKLTHDLAQSQLQVIHYEQEIRESRAILEKRLQQSINTISRIGELRDMYTAGHQRRVKNLACAIAREMGYAESAVMNLSYGALIHDIGKIYIASDILNKPGKISNLEYQILQTHSEQGHNIVKGVDFPDVIPTMIYQHHERLDGSGYPNGLSGDQIISESRILAVADVVEAMSSHRPYRPALGIDVALNEIETFKGTKFDPQVVDICIRLFKEKAFKFED